MTASAAEPHPAATVIVLRPAESGHEPEVLLTHRPATMAFAAGLQVFPGGRVDAADADPRLAERSARSAIEAARVLGGNVEPAAALALHVAAIRELHEEAGVWLGDQPAGQATHLWTDRLSPIAHWTTPSFMPRRFSTWFFVADLPPGAKLSFAPDEVEAHRWVTPTIALEQLAAGDIKMWIPTVSALHLLIELGAATAAEVAERHVIGRATSPQIEVVGPAETRITFGSAGGVPGRTGLAQILGRRDLVVVDPGDPSESVIDAITDVVARHGGTIQAIVLTAADPAHGAAADALAIPLTIPILVAPGGGRHLPYATRELAEAERLPADVELRVRLGPVGSGRLTIEAPSAGE